MHYEQPVMLDWVKGDATGLMIPAHAEALRAAGAEFLTTAFRAYGWLAADNRVSRITRFETCAVGSTGDKVFLAVAFERPDASLPTDLFVKFSRDFTDAFRDRRRRELESEIRLCELSLLPDFPIRVPTPRFADFEEASGTGLLITERIAFGAGGIEPLRPKCLDQDLSDPLAYYRAILVALARLAAAHRSGRLGDHVDRSFPFDARAAAAEDKIPFGETYLRERLSELRTFARDHGQLLPQHLTGPAFIDSLENEMLRFLRHEARIKDYLYGDPDYVALTHFNANVDNAWFWRDATGTLQCGLLDWQRARQMNVAFALWGGLNAAGTEIWANHLDELLALFVGELHGQGGPRLDLEELKVHLHLYAAIMGLAGLMMTPTLVLSRLPEAATASGPLDPLFRKSEAARSFLCVFTNFLDMWSSGGMARSLDRALSQTKPVASPIPAE